MTAIAQVANATQQLITTVARETAAQIVNIKELELPQLHEYIGSLPDDVKTLLHNTMQIEGSTDFVQLWAIFKQTKTLKEMEAFSSTLEFQQIASRLFKNMVIQGCLDSSQNTEHFLEGVQKILEEVPAKTVEMQKVISETIEQLDEPLLRIWNAVSQQIKS